MTRKASWAAANAATAGRRKSAQNSALSSANLEGLAAGGSICARSRAQLVSISGVSLWNSLISWISMPSWRRQLPQDERWLSTLARSASSSWPVAYHGSSSSASSCGASEWTGSGILGLLDPIIEAARDHLLQPAAGVEHSRLNRVHWATHDLSDLAIAHAMEICEIDDRTVVCRKLIHRIDERIMEPLTIEILVGCGISADPLVRRFLNRIRPAGLRLHCLAVGNGEDPRRGLACSAEPSGSLPHDHHRIVEHLLDQLRALREVDQEPREPRLVYAVQPFERMQVSTADAPQQLAFFELAWPRDAGPGAARRP